MFTDTEIVKRKLFLFNQAIRLLSAEGKMKEATEVAARMAKLLVGDASYRKSETKADGSFSLHHR